MAEEASPQKTKQKKNPSTLKAQKNSHVKNQTHELMLPENHEEKRAIDF